MCVLKNIERDYCYGWGVGICAGNNWVATPFILNYGYDHNYESDMYTWESQDKNGKKFVVYNKFDDKELIDLVAAGDIDKVFAHKTAQFERRFFRTVVVKYATPHNYRYNLELGKLGQTTHFNAVKYNCVHIYFYGNGSNRRVRIACSFINDLDACNISKDDIQILYDEHYVGFENGNMMLTITSNHFKDTFRLYSKDCYVRTLIHPSKNNGGQYTERLRVDSGRTRKTKKYDRFSIIKTVKLDDDLFNRLKYLIPILPLANFDESSDEDEI